MPINTINSNQPINAYPPINNNNMYQQNPHNQQLMNKNYTFPTNVQNQQYMNNQATDPNQ